MIFRADCLGNLNTNEAELKDVDFKNGSTYLIMLNLLLLSTLYIFSVCFHGIFDDEWRSGSSLALCVGGGRFDSHNWKMVVNDFEFFPVFIMYMYV